VHRSIRDSKGGKDRVTMLPRTLSAPLQTHLQNVRQIHDRDRAAGWGKVQLPAALDRKYPSASADWRWQWVFPQARRWKNATTGEQGRHHVHETIVQRTMKETVCRARLAKHASCHTLRIRSPPTLWKRAMTSAPSRSCSGTRARTRR
jgi:hypothetical protein